jgi:solute:Na+ symporter, SSS family
MSSYDYAVVVIYFIFISSIGLVFRKFTKSTSDYFRGGGNVLWWLVGATAFMSQFSAWTFTGAASKAYVDGTLIMVLYFGNALGYFLAFVWSAPRFRQMRVVTPMEAIRDRFGKPSEQFFTWIWLPIGICYAAIWLYSVSLFISVVFGWHLIITIIVVGFVVLFVASLGGSWAVIASDFMQCMILIPISLVVAFLSIKAVGACSFFNGASNFLDKLPKNHLDWTAILQPKIVYLWVTAMLIKQFCTINNLNDSNRFLFSKDTKNARKAALLASLLFVVGPIIWFIPPMAAAILYPDLNAIEALRPLGGKIAEGAYVGMGLQYLPMGMIGLMVSAIFAATMSPMDTGLNKNAGIFVRNFYKPILRKHASDTEYVVVGKIVSVVFGFMVIGVAIAIDQLEGVGLFDIMNNFSAGVTVPFVIPLIWGIIIKKTPSWSGWSTVLVGFTTSLTVFLVNKNMDPSTIQYLFGLDKPLSLRERPDLLLLSSLFANVIVSSTWFIGTSFFARYNPPEFTAQEDEFFERMNTPLVTDDATTREMDIAQYTRLAFLCLPYGIFVMLLCIIPNDFTGRLCFIFAGGVITAIGLILWRKAKKTAALIGK